MFPFYLAQASPPPQEIVQPQEVRPLPGALNQIPVFNSNSPELVLKEGILLSTFPTEGKAFPTAHLNFPLQGRFDLFAHHVAKASPPDNLRTLYLGIILHNPGKETVTVDILQGGSYLSQPDAPFIPLPSQVNNNSGTVYSGPGSRVMGEILNGQHPQNFPHQLEIPPGERQMLMNLPIPVRTLDPPINGRSTYLRLRSDGIVYVASLAKFAPETENGQERAPNKSEWEQILETGELATPRDRIPTPPNQTSGSIIYGRVAGVSLGSQWKVSLTDTPESSVLTIPATGEQFSYGLSTLDRGRLGTNQNQSAPMSVRYPDTAYQAHGNYGVQYSLTLPLYNPKNESQTVAIALQTPIKQDELVEGLRFFNPPPEQIFFRGTVRIRYTDDQGIPQIQNFHLVQRRGEQGNPLATLTLSKKSQRLVDVDFLYPPDATPPQVLTIQTLVR